MQDGPGGTDLAGIGQEDRQFTLILATWLAD